MKATVGIFCFALTLLAVPPAQSQPASTETAPVAPVAGEDAAVIRLRPGQLPEVRLSGALLYRLLVAEMAAQQGDYAGAAATTLGLARTIGDARLAQRALELYLQDNDVAGALAAARDWLRIAPDDDAARAAELTLRAAAGQTEGLAAALRARIAAAGEDAAARAEAIAQARLTLARLRDRALALALLDRALPPEARRVPEARLALAALAHAAGDHARALTEARLALALQPDSEEAAHWLLDYGVQGEDAGVLQTVLQDVRRFVARHPHARRLRLALAQAFNGLQRFDDALAELQAMAQLAPEDFDLLFMQAQVLYGAERFDEARARLDDYVAVQSQRRVAGQPDANDAELGLADAWVLLARIAEREDRLEDAVELLARVDAASDGDDAMRHAVRLRRALLLARLGRVEEALALARGADGSAVDADDDDTIRGALTAAQILRGAGRVGDAIAELVAIDADFPDTVAVKYDLAMLYERADNLAEFERLLRAVVALEPDHAQAYNALGYTLADRGERLAEAQTLLARAHALSPDDPYILDSLGWLYYRLGEHGQALAYLQRAWDARAEVDIAAHLGEVLWQTGQRDAALRRWREGAAIDPDNDTLRETLERLGAPL